MQKNGERARSRKLSSVRSLLRYLFKKSEIDSNVADKVDSPKVHEQPITRLEIDEVVNLLNLIDKNHVDLEIEIIDVTNVDEVIVKLTGGKIEVNFGDMTNINLKIQFLPEVLKDVGNKRGTILMNSTDDDLQPRFFEKM